MYSSWPPQLLGSVKGAGAALTEMSSWERYLKLDWATQLSNSMCGSKQSAHHSWLSDFYSLAKYLIPTAVLEPRRPQISGWSLGWIVKLFFRIFGRMLLDQFLVGLLENFLELFGHFSMLWSFGLTYLMNEKPRLSIDFGLQLFVTTTTKCHASWSLSTGPHHILILCYLCYFDFVQYK